MKIVSLELKNIRSYKQEKIDFPEGLVLLAGDIGSGKSTLLLAIEFALFGLRRGEISGTSLLRHGASEGTATLTFTVKNETYTVKRSLKRTATSVAQGPGTIVHDGVTTDMTAVELRAKILELLNYPESLLSQTKSLVFRYTVYTPQEQMKHILFEKPEERLDTMRKLFALDKYKRIRENVTLVGRELRTSIERLRGQGDDIQELKQQQEKNKQELNACSAKKQILAQTTKETLTALKKEQEALEKLTVEAKAHEENRREHAIIREQLVAAKNTLQRTRNELLALKEIKIDVTLSEKKEQLKKQLASTEAEQKTLQEKITLNTKNEALLEAKAEQAHTHASITEIETCPTCKQEVGEAYKQEITEKTQSTLKKIAERKELIAQTQERLQQELAQKTQEQKSILAATQELVQEVARAEAAQKNNELRKQKQKQEQELVGEISFLEKKENVLSVELKKYDAKKIDVQREKTRTKDEQYQQARLAEARHAEQEKALFEQQKQVTEKITQKETAQLRADKLNKQHEWLTKHFGNLMYTIEKHVLATLYHNFNDAFKEWFDKLLEDDTISVRLDHDFSPLVEQNGYETLIENLSGGEKTSVALAYRLALNNVINQALHDLHTDGVLILDEPTDGFSSEQLDRVQEVLSELSLEQILVVSHEPKMESFMDHVIRVTKNEHESSVHL